MHTLHLSMFCLAMMLAVLLKPANAQEAPPPATVRRDPFWPIGYVPKSDHEPVQAPVEEPEETLAAPALTEEELRALARAEAERIRQTLERDRTATARMGTRIETLIHGRWVGVGDSFSVEVDGRQYRLLITKLTTDNIELEPHRVPRITPNPGNEQ
ncbi:MAG: hypothetical protein JJU29_21880 [Verrucomicrobia bacterium]|nr:hypothetical protein [Verrucomicrobiota bacterium]MCH8513716.1 hypothetical protein [Kiritimatiellia bacterium]